MRSWLIGMLLAVVGCGKTELAVTNGDFELGYYGFSHEFDLTSGEIDREQIAITDDLAKVHFLTSSIKDHTSGTGNMMVVNGTFFPPKSFWQQDVAVEPNTDYTFSLWVNGWKMQNGVTYPAAGIEFQVDHQQIGDRFNAPQSSPATQAWQNHRFTFNSQNRTTITLRLVNINNGLGDLNLGNDFLVDDISLVKASEAEERLGKAKNQQLPETTAKPTWEEYDRAFEQWAKAQASLGIEGQLFAQEVGAARKCLRSGNATAMAFMSPRAVAKAKEFSPYGSANSPIID